MGVRETFNQGNRRGTEKEAERGNEGNDRKRTATIKNKKVRETSLQLETRCLSQ